MESEDKKLNHSITKQSEDFAAWYQDVIIAADLAEHAPIRGCMTMKPNGYAIWENIQKELDKQFKEFGVQNAYFPLFIPESYLKKEAEHIEGFSPELAVVTHAGGRKLDEPLVIRPTSETIIYEAFSRWIQSYRDLPLLINQWANVVRWEIRTRLFLRTSEFLWQEGHTAHAKAEEAEEYAKNILENVYKKFAEEFLAIPVYTGTKSENEKFAGAKQTFSIEALMKDGKALQFGTAHDLSDHFSKSFNVKYLDQEGKEQYVYISSWGVSTRMIGGLIMAHGDDKGIILPPKIAPTQIVIIPITVNRDREVLDQAEKIAFELKQNYQVQIDNRVELRPGEKYYEWEKRGIPLRIEIGQRDLEAGQCIFVRRDTGEKNSVVFADIQEEAKKTLDEIQNNLFKSALKFREETNSVVDTWEDFIAATEKGGFIFAYWCEDPKCELEIKEKTKTTTRCLPFDTKNEIGEHKCIHCGKSAKAQRWIFARSY